MNEPIHTRLRHLRRSAGLTQDDIARCLGVGGRSYVAMLEAGDRVPHVRDSFYLRLLFQAGGETVFPHLYQHLRQQFQVNLREAIEAVIAEEGSASSGRVRFLRDALTAVELDGNTADDTI